MTFQVRIQNLGKLADATVRVAPLTVLAGPNNTGKTFFSKALYSVLDAVNANLPYVAVDFWVNPVWEELTRLSGKLAEDKGETPPNLRPHLDSAIDIVARMADAVITPPASNKDMYRMPHPVLRELTQELEKVYAALQPEIKNWISRKDAPITFAPPADFLTPMSLHINSLVGLGNMTWHGLATQGLAFRGGDVFSGNFQIANLSDLKKSEEQPATVQIVDAGIFRITDGTTIFPDVSYSGLRELQRMSSRAIYLDSPALWKLKSVLARAGQEYSGSRRVWRALRGAPRYFYNLVDDMSRKYQGEAIISEETRRLAKEVVRGKVVMNEATGELLFAEVGEPKPRSLSVVSTGVANLGVLAMLIEQKVVDKNSFLFIDEPEAHLHPGWQVDMLRLLFALAREGVHVVMATHSSDMMERLSAMVKKHPGSEKMIALNHFSRDGVNVGGDKEFRKRMGDILAELTEAFSDSYMMNQELLDQESS